MAFRAELKGMKRVLRRLGFTSKDDVVEQKGRAACEIDTGDELVICELIYDGVFNDLKPEVWHHKLPTSQPSALCPRKPLKTAEYEAQNLKLSLKSILENSHLSTNFHHALGSIPPLL